MKTTQQHETVYRFRAKPDDTLAEWIDKAASTTASRWCGGHCVVASIGHFHLDRPIGVGELVEVHATLVYTGRCSMHILVTVCSSDPTSSNGQTAQCPIIFVAVDKAGSPVEVPQWVPVTMLDLQRQRQARVRIGMRKRIEEAMVSEDHSWAGHATLRHRACGADVDADGRVRGGRVMQWIDEAACASGADWTGAEAITAYVAGIRFSRCIRQGDTVTVSARVIHTGPRSVHTSIHVTVENPSGGETTLAALGVMVVVSLDIRGDARPVAAWEPGSDEDRRLDEHARRLIELRQFNEPFTTAVA